MTAAPSTESSSPVFAWSMEQARRASEQAAAERDDRVVVVISAAAGRVAPGVGGTNTTLTAKVLTWRR